MSRICLNSKITLLQNTPEPVDWLDYCCRKDEFSLTEKHMYQLKDILGSYCFTGNTFIFPWTKIIKYF